MTSIELDIQKFTGMTEEEITKVLFTLREKGFLDDDNSLQWFLMMLEVAHKQGGLDFLKTLGEKIKLGEVEEF